MATESPTSLENLTTCTVCLETFTGPKILSCQHSYCYACLMLLGKDESTITCPYCQREHPIPDTGIPIPSSNGNLLLNNLVGMSIPRPEVCTDCKERPPVPDECEHCGQKICQMCLVEHAILSMELTNSLNELKENLTPNPADNEQKLQTFKTNLESERTKMNEMFKTESLKKLIELKILLERVQSMEKLMTIIEDLYDTLSSDDDESKISSYISKLSEEIGGGKTLNSMKDLGNNMTDLKAFVRLIQTKDEEFKFRYSTSPQEGSGQLEFGQALVNVRGNYLTQNIVDQITQFVQDSAETLTNHVTPTCPPRADHMVSLPTAPNTADAKTETEEKFLEIEKDKESIVSQGNNENEHSTDSDANVQPARHSAKDENQEISLSCPMPAKPPGTSVGEYGQNELPRHVDYTGKASRRGVVAIGQGRSVEEENRLHYPQSCAYHVERDEIFVADWNNQRIMAYSSDGRKARVYTEVKDPCDVAVSSDGKHVYIAAETSLIKVNMDGKHVKTIKHFSSGDIQFCLSVVCHREFTVVVDNNHECVIVFNDRDEEVRCIGREHLKNPRSVALSEDGMFYITDNKSSCVKMFDWSSQYLQTFAGTDRNNDIEGIAVDGEGNVCVSRPDSHRIDVYSPRRELLTSIGGFGTNPGELNRPNGLCLTPDGRLLVADDENNRVQTF